MRMDRKRNCPRRGRTGGFSLIEILIVVFVVMVVAAIAVPNVLLAVANIRLRASAGDLPDSCSRRESLPRRTILKLHPFTLSSTPSLVGDGSLT